MCNVMVELFFGGMWVIGLRCVGSGICIYFFLTCIAGTWVVCFLCFGCWHVCGCCLWLVYLYVLELLSLFGVVND